ncbi:hypothetical protein HN747_05170, partial [archaeon]|nr:hypothetical protein [archaeon]
HVEYRAEETPVGWYLRYVRPVGPKRGRSGGIILGHEDLGFFWDVEELLGAVKADWALRQFDGARNNPDYGTPPASWVPVESGGKVVPGSRKEWAWSPEEAELPIPSPRHAATPYGTRIIRRRRKLRRYRLSASLGLDNKTISYSLYLVTGYGRREFLASSKDLNDIVEQATADWMLRQFTALPNPRAGVREKKQHSRTNPPRGWEKMLAKAERAGGWAYTQKERDEPESVIHRRDRREGEVSTYIVIPRGVWAGSYWAISAWQKQPPRFLYRPWLEHPGAGRGYEWVTPFLSDSRWVSEGVEGRKAVVWSDVFAREVREARRAVLQPFLLAVMTATSEGIRWRDLEQLEYEEQREGYWNHALYAARIREEKEKMAGKLAVLSGLSGRSPSWISNKIMEEPRRLKSVDDLWLSSTQRERVKQVEGFFHKWSGAGAQRFLYPNVEPQIVRLTSRDPRYAFNFVPSAVATAQRFVRGDPETQRWIDSWDLPRAAVAQTIHIGAGFKRWGVSAKEFRKLLKTWNIQGARHYLDVRRMVNEPATKEVLAESREGRRVLAALAGDDKKKAARAHDLVVNAFNEGAQRKAEGNKKENASMVRARREFARGFRYPKGVALLAEEVDYVREGQEMYNCVGGYPFDRQLLLFSLKCSDGSRASLSLHASDGQVEQFYGPRDRPPSSSCRALLAEFLEMNKDVINRMKKEGRVRYNPRLPGAEMSYRNPKGKNKAAQRKDKKRRNKVPRRRSAVHESAQHRGSAGPMGPKEGKGRKVSDQRKRGGRHDWRKDVEDNPRTNLLGGKRARVPASILKRLIEYRLADDLLWRLPVRRAEVALRELNYYDPQEDQWWSPHPQQREKIWEKMIAAYHQRRAARAQKNPSDVEWMVVTPHSNLTEMAHMAAAFVRTGYATDFSLRKTTEGRKQAVALKLMGVPEIRVNNPDMLCFAGRYSPFSRTPRSMANQEVIKFIFGSFGPVSGNTTYARTNPARVALPPLPGCTGDDFYDPREESIRAQEKRTGFPVARGFRSVYKSWPIARIIDVSRQRYAGTYMGSKGDRRRTIDDLIRGRQAYEQMLCKQSEARGFPQRGPYRVLKEITEEGLRFFLWPLPAGQRTPKPYKTLQGAESARDRLYRAGTRPARELPGKKYTKRELAHWLPPAWVFNSFAPRSSRSRRKRSKKARSNSQIKIPPRLRAAAQKFVRETWELKTGGEKIFPLVGYLASGWPYLKGKSSRDYIRSLPRPLQRLCVAAINKYDPQAAGYYKDGEGEMVIYLKESQGKRALLPHLEEAVDHELRHYLQDILKASAGLYAGMPALSFSAEERRKFRKAKSLLVQEGRKAEKEQKDILAAGGSEYAAYTAVREKVSSAYREAAEFLGLS